VGSIGGVAGVELWKSIYELTQEFQHQNPFEDVAPIQGS
jgi:hypothetical protein